MTIYIVIEHDQPWDKGYPFLNLEEYLDDHNEYMGTDYRTAEQFNELHHCHLDVGVRLENRNNARRYFDGD